MKILVLIYLIVFSSNSKANGLSCAKYYDTGAVKINGKIDSIHRKMIIDSINKVQQNHLSKQVQSSIKFEVVSDKSFAGAQTDLSESVIKIQKHSFSLSNQAFQALIEHEINHLYVIRNFNGPDKKSSLFEYLQYRSDDPKTLMAIENHWVFAELLCDLIPVLNNREPKIIKDLQEQLVNILPADVSQQLSQTLKLNSPIELSLRDFSLSSDDPRWTSFNPKASVNYHRLNQIRSFLWSKWIRTLPRGKNALFYQTVESVFNQVQQEYYFESILQQTDLYSLNQDFINLLDSKITEALKEN